MYFCTQFLGYNMKDIYQNINAPQTVEISKAATMLGTSIITIRNWIKYGYLQVSKKKNRIFLLMSEVKKLQNDIENGTFTKLNSRANKSKVKKFFVPIEYSQNKNHIILIQSIVDYIKEHHIPTSTALALLSLNVLCRKDLLVKFTIKDIINKRLIFKNKQIEKEMQDWLSDLKITKELLFLSSCRLPKQKDVLGFIYQSLMMVGEKAQAGSYYTPSNIVDDIIKTYVKPRSRVLDPCCGTGQFLLAFSHKIKNPMYIYGIDRDELAVRIARLNLLIAFKNLDFSPNIFHKDSLFDRFDYDDFDVVATNPPWGFHFSLPEKQQLKQLYAPLTSSESFSYFLKKGIDSACEGGIISFILPESILLVRKHQDIRRYIIENTYIQKIIYLDRVFKHVFTPIVRLDLVKKKTPNKQINICKGDKVYTANQLKWEQNPDFNFDIHINNFDSQILDKIYAYPHTTLEKQADWALGIVTGNNKKYLSNELQNGYEEIITGKDIEKFSFKQASYFIRFTPKKFQQSAPETKYRAKEKLIYRFISKYLIFAYDDKQRLCLNSANILIPQIPHYPIKVIAALFNSTLYQFIFQKKYACIKVLQSHLEQLPLPLWNDNSFHQLLILSDHFMNGENNANEMDDFIMKQYGLSKEETDYIHQEVI